MRTHILGWKYLAAGGIFLASLLWWMRAPMESLAPGAPAPSFHLTDLSGRPASLSEYRGKILLLDFWATWCQSCLEEVPDLKRLYTQFQGYPFELLALSLDEEGAKNVSSFAARNQLPYRIALADPLTARSYRVWALPVKYLIDSGGSIYRKYVGEVEPSLIEADIRMLLNQQTHST